MPSAGCLNWISEAETGMDSCLCAKWPLARQYANMTVHKTGSGFPLVISTLKGELAAEDF